MNVSLEVETITASNFLIQSRSKAGRLAELCLNSISALVDFLSFEGFLHFSLLSSPHSIFPKLSLVKLPSLEDLSLSGLRFVLFPIHVKRPSLLYPSNKGGKSCPWRAYLCCVLHLWTALIQAQESGSPWDSCALWGPVYPTFFSADEPLICFFRTVDVNEEGNSH